MLYMLDGSINLYLHCCLSYMRLCLTFLPSLPAPRFPGDHRFGLWDAQVLPWVSSEPQQRNGRMRQRHVHRRSVLRRRG